MEVLKKLADEKGCTASQLAIAWVMNQGDDILPMLGTTKVSRLKEYLGAVDIKLSEAELKNLSDAFPEGTFAGERYDENQMKIVVNGVHRVCRVHRVHRVHRVLEFLEFIEFIESRVLRVWRDCRDCRD